MGAMDQANQSGNSAEIRRNFRPFVRPSVREIPAEWVAGSAVKLGIFSDFWRGAIARAKNRKKCFKNGGGISAEIAPKFRRNGSAT